MEYQIRYCGGMYSHFNRDKAESLLLSLFKGDASKVHDFFAEKEFVLVKRVDEDRAALIDAKFKNVGIKLKIVELDNGENEFIRQKDKSVVASKLEKATVLAGKLKSGMMNDKEISFSSKKEWGLYLTILAFVFGSIWVAPWYDRWFSDKDTVLNFPSIVNGAVGLFMCMPMYIRGFIEFKHISIYRCVTLLFNWLLFSSISQIILGPDNTLENNFSSMCLFGGMLLTWLGLRSVAGFCWLFFVFIALFNLAFNSKLPQFTGFLFLACGFFSLMFQMNLVPVEMYNRFKVEFKNINPQVIDSIKEDVSAAADKTASAASTVASTAIKGSVGMV